MVHGMFNRRYILSSSLVVLVGLLPPFILNTGVNRKDDTEKDTEKDTEHQRAAARAN